MRKNGLYALAATLAFIVPTTAVHAGAAKTADTAAKNAGNAAPAKGADTKGSSAAPKKGAPDKPTKVDPKLFQTTPAGLKYAVLKEGTGKVATPGTIVTVHYTGWLESTGEKFDSSLDRDQAFFFELGAGKVIKGWDQGVAGMKVGEKRQLQIPSELGYGARGAGAKIPPGANLVFDVELLRVDKE